MTQLQLHYYNTTDLSGETLQKEEKNAVNQEERIYYLFQIYREGTPSEMMKRYDKRWPSIPLTSIRRSLTNLTKEGKLYMSDKMFTGLYNKPEHVWCLRE